MLMMPCNLFLCVIVAFCGSKRLMICHEEAQKSRKRRAIMTNLIRSPFVYLRAFLWQYRELPRKRLCGHSSAHAWSFSEIAERGNGQEIPSLGSS
jgi:hypothetical protein